MRINGKDKIAILEDKYNSMEDTDYKKKQLWGKIEMLKRKLTPNVLWSGHTPYKKALHEGAQEVFEQRLEQANAPAEVKED
jgi:hypothetical protein